MGSCCSCSNYDVVTKDTKTQGQAAVVDVDEGNIEFSQSNKGNENSEQQQQIYSGDVLESVKIDWSEMNFDTTRRDTILGYGMFGVVIRGTWTPRNGGDEQDVAVKLFIQSTDNFPEEEFLRLCCAAYDEIETMRKAETSIGSSEHIVKAHGLLMGPLPSSLSSVIDLQQEGLALSGVGIVMRNEAGGTLTNLVYPRKKGTPFPLHDKLRILAEIAKGLASLHAAGIVHADIKPANILLSGDTPPRVRLADFGLSILRTRNINASIVKSTLAMTTQTQGTPVYYAPEMLFNPYEKPEKGANSVVAKPSRKTDMYAFALLCWQTLSQRNLFPDITTETVLASMIHKGYRPPIEELPQQTPQNVIDMIVSCWEKDRSKRKSAAECNIIIQHSLDELEIPAPGPDPFAPMQIKWADLSIDTSRPERSVVGYGTFGVVVKGYLRGDGDEPPRECAVKIFIQENLEDVPPAEEYQRICKRAVQEARLILRAGHAFNSLGTDNVIRCYGVVIDTLPDSLLRMLQKHQSSSDFEYTGVGTVMRYESGGSLSGLLYPPQRVSRRRGPIPMYEKTRIILGIARALAGLHAAGIVHADLKLENVLLSGDNPPEVRIADFGSSLFGPRPSNGLGKSSLAMTTHIMGSPVYNAPEILFNPYEHQTTTAKPSRKTDMYAFALMSWEVLSQAELFPDINSEAVLATVVHQGTRPPLGQLPRDTPTPLIEMITSCWDKDRQRRKTASQCVTILLDVLSTLPPPNLSRR